MSSKKQSQDLDIITPIAEVFHELCMSLANLSWELIKFTYRKVTNTEPPLTKIDRKKLAVKKTTANKEALGIDTSTKKDLLLDDIDFSHHSFIIGASGFGKTNLITIMQEHYLRKGLPIVFIDPKGDLEALTNFKNLCESYGKNCHVFSESYSEAIKLNPVIDGTISQVVDRIMCSFDWSEQYYEDMATRALRKALEDLENDEKEFSLRNIYDVLIEKYDTKETTGLIVKIENIVKSDFGKFLSGSKDDLTFKKIKEERDCLYIGLSTQGYGKTAMNLGKIFLGEIMFNSYKIQNTSSDSEKNKENPIAVFFDEFGALATPRFIELENKCRGAGIDLSMAVQSIADIDRVDPHLATQILESAANWFILKQRMASSASTLSESIGTYLTSKTTDATENGESAGRGTVREVHELLVHTDVIKTLKVGQCILMRQKPEHRLNLINIRRGKGGDLIKIKKQEIIQKEAVF